MTISGKVHCFFEQSGTFKNEFKKLGYEAEDYDIQNNFGETDHVIDLFAEIDNAYDGKPSLFDRIDQDDLIVAFYPCIYFCESSQCAFRIWHFNYRKLTDSEKFEKILKRTDYREEFYKRLIKFVCVCKCKKIRLIIENPYSGIGYLHNNFLKDPDIIDMNRMARGDYFKKPTAYWFWNCEPTHGFTGQWDKEQKIIRKTKISSSAGLCSEDRSMISSDYARNWICDFVLGVEQNSDQISLFEQEDER